MEYLITEIEVIWENIQILANSNFFLALIGAGAGAYFGARGAQKITENYRRKKDLEKEMRSTDVAILLASSIFNNYINFKDSAVNPIKDYYDRLNQELSEHERENGNYHGFNFRADFRDIPPLSIQTDSLRSLTYEKTSLKARPISAFSTLVDNIQKLDHLVIRRNQMIKVWLERSPDSEKNLLAFYF